MSTIAKVESGSFGSIFFAKNCIIYSALNIFCEQKKTWKEKEKQDMFTFRTNSKTLYVYSQSNHMLPSTIKHRLIVITCACLLLTSKKPSVPGLFYSSLNIDSHTNLLHYTRNLFPFLDFFAHITTNQYFYTIEMSQFSNFVINV